MGGLISRFRSKPFAATDYAEILETLEKELLELRERKNGYLGRHRSAMMNLLIIFFIVEVVLIIWYYLWPKPEDLVSRGLYLLPVILVPVFCWALKRIITRYYNWRIRYSDERLQEIMDTQRAKVLELKRITNFEVIMSLLARYDHDAKLTPTNTPQRQPQQTPSRPQQTPARQPQQQPMTTPARQQQQQPITTPGPQQTPARQEPQQPHQPQQTGPQATPGPLTTPARQQPQQPAVDPTASEGLRQRPGKSATYVMPVPKAAMNNPMLPATPPTPHDANRKKGFFDRCVDWMVGDGPAYSTPVQCKRCKALHSYLPQGEVAPQFTCPGCGTFNGNGLGKPEEAKKKDSDSKPGTAKPAKKEKKDTPNTKKEKAAKEKAGNKEKEKKKKERDTKKESEAEVDGDPMQNSDDAFLVAEDTTSTKDDHASTNDNEDAAGAEKRRDDDAEREAREREEALAGDQD